MELAILIERAYYVICGVIVGYLLAQLDVYLWQHFDRYRDENQRARRALNR